MPFGNLNKIKNEIERQEKEVDKARSLLYNARWTLLHYEQNKDEAMRQISEAIEILTQVSG